MYEKVWEIHRISASKSTETPSRSTPSNLLRQPLAGAATDLHMQVSRCLEEPLGLQPLALGQHEALYVALELRPKAVGEAQLLKPAAHGFGEL